MSLKMVCLSFFDNLQVTHIRGPVLEETHYYPFGLTMAGISSKALAFGNPENKKKYNDIEFNSDLGLNNYEAFYRNLDIQIGRWWQIDPEIENMEQWSPYVSNYDNPIFFFDPRGDWPDWLDVIVDAGKKVLISVAGVTNGVANTVTGGLVSSDPFNFRRKLNDEELKLYDNSVTVGKGGGLFIGIRSSTSKSSPPVELAPVGSPGKPISITIEPAPPLIAPFSAKTERSASDEKLIKEAQEAKAKEEAAKQRQANRKAQTAEGKEKVGQSNQGTRGSHNSGGNKPETHQAAEARRARKQAAADAAKEAAKKKK